MPFLFSLIVMCVRGSGEGLTNKTMKYTRTYKDIIKDKDPSQTTIPVWQALLFGLLFWGLLYAYYFLMQ